MNKLGQYSLKILSVAVCLFLLYLALRIFLAGFEFGKSPMANLFQVILCTILAVVIGYESWEYLFGKRKEKR